MGAVKGTRPPNAGKGRVKGVPNKLTANAREAFQHAFNAIGGPESLAVWAAANPTEFYKLFARLIPNEISGPNGAAVPLNIRWMVEHIPTERP